MRIYLVAIFIYNDLYLQKPSGKKMDALPGPQGEMSLHSNCSLVFQNVLTIQTVERTSHSAPALLPGLWAAPAEHRPSRPGWLYTLQCPAHENSQVWLPEVHGIPYYWHFVQANVWYRFPRRGIAGCWGMYVYSTSLYRIISDFLFLSGARLEPNKIKAST